MNYSDKFDFECDCDAPKSVVLIKIPKNAIDSLNYKNNMSKNLICESCKKAALEFQISEYGTLFPE